MDTFINSSSYLFFLIFVILMFHYSNESFIMSFQSKDNELSTEVWAEYVEKIPVMKEFTSCLWEKLEHFATDYTSVWGHCKEKLNGGSTIKCTQFYHRGNAAFRDQKIILYGWLAGQFQVEVEIPNYRHKTWNHFCWQYSSLTGNSTFYYNGKQVGISHLEQKPVVGSDEELPEAFVIGQEQDEIRGRYELSQMFDGEIAELNIWNRLLNESEIVSLANCNVIMKGNIVKWEKKKYRLNEVIVLDVLDEKIFCKPRTQYALFSQLETLDNAKTLCSIHGGRIAAPISLEENNAIMNILNEHGSDCLNMNTPQNYGKAIWLGFERLNDDWYETNDDIPIARASYGNWDPFQPIYPDLGCTFLQTNGYWSFRDTPSCRSMELCTICKFEDVPLFSLKGDLCEIYSPFDWNYYFSINESYQISHYDGYKQGKISSHDQNWIHAQEGTSISLEGSNHPLGRRYWKWYNRRCNTDNEHRKLLTFSVCEFGAEFTCTSGRCIPIRKRCDETSDCKDGSDENNCSLVKIPKTYNKIEPPSSLSSYHPIPVFTQIKIIDFNIIDTSKMLVELTVEIIMTWKDTRLMFANLKPGKKNPISDQVVEQLWLPLDNIIHENAIIGKIYSDGMRKVNIIKTSNPAPLTGFEIYEEHMYEGSENELEMSQRFRIEYNCLFKLKKFPFDEQECEIILKMPLEQNNSVSLSLPLSNNCAPLSYNGDMRTGQFEIEKLYANTSLTENSSFFVGMIRMKRIYNYQMTSTFAPTFLLWLLAYSTLFITKDQFNVRFMGSVTSLLVLSSLLNSITTTLPKTSYFKDIDLWFLVYLANIFCLIICHLLVNQQHNLKNDLVPAHHKIMKVASLRHRKKEKSSKKEFSNHGWIESNNSSWEKELIRNRCDINIKAIIIFPIQIILFNLMYFILTTS